MILTLRFNVISHWLSAFTKWPPGSQHSSLQNTVETLYIIIYYSKYFIELNFEKIYTICCPLNAQKTSPFQASYGVSFMSTSTEIDRAIQGFYSTVWCRYNMANCLPNLHNRQPIACPWGRAMGCLAQVIFWFMFCCCGPSYAIRHPTSLSTLVKVIACVLDGTKPLPEPMLAYQY